MRHVLFVRPVPFDEVLLGSLFKCSTSICHFDCLQDLCELYRLMKKVSDAVEGRQKTWRCAITDDSHDVLKVTVTPECVADLCFSCQCVGRFPPFLCCTRSVITMTERQIGRYGTISEDFLYKATLHMVTRLIPQNGRR
jgi:hypothetical protein